MDRYHLHIGFVLFLIMVLFRSALEVTPSKHVLVLMPGLAIAGAFLVDGLLGKKVPLNEASANGVTILSVAMILFWMLPRYIDQSLVNPSVEVFKFLTIPIVIGGGLAVSWRKTNLGFRRFLKAKAIIMMAVLGLLYMHLPVQICNSYLISEQRDLGLYFLLVAMSSMLFSILHYLLWPKISA